MLTVRKCRVMVCQVDGHLEVGVKNWEGGFTDRYESAPAGDGYVHHPGCGAGSIRVNTRQSYQAMF